MSKRDGNGGGFNNRAARKFRDNPKIDRMSQDEIFEILEEDMTTILQQVTDHRNHKGKYPTYTGQMFANLSVPLYFYRYIQDHVKPNYRKGKIKTDLEADQIESLKQILADAYKRSATMQYERQNQEFTDRNKLLSKAFRILDARGWKLTKKLKGLTKVQRRDLLIQAYGDPVLNMRFVHKIINNSSASDKVKLRVLKKLYKGRFAEAVGAALTVESNRSDSIELLYNYMAKKKAKKRAPYIRAYAEAYKTNGTHNNMWVNNEFAHANRKIIRELKMIDIGYKKAFKRLKGDVKKKGKKEDTLYSAKEVLRKNLDAETDRKGKK